MCMNTPIQTPSVGDRRPLGRHTRARTTRRTTLSTRETTFSTHRLIARTHAHRRRYARARASEREGGRDGATGEKRCKSEEKARDSSWASWATRWTTNAMDDGRWSEKITRASSSRRRSSRRRRVGVVVASCVSDVTRGRPLRNVVSTRVRTDSMTFDGGIGRLSMGGWARARKRER